MLYIRVYAPDGEPFDVIRDVADNVLLNLGWTQMPTSPTEEIVPPVAHTPKNDAE